MRKSINKTTVVIVLAIFLTLSVGYALFSDTITIEGTATAQGKFDIEATCITNIPDDLKTAIGNNLYSDTIQDLKNYSNEGGYKNESCEIVNDKVTYTVELEYPGAQKWFIVKLTNVGTIDAKIESDIETALKSVDTVKWFNNDGGLIKTTNQGFLNGSGPLFQKNDGSYINLNDEIEDDMKYIIDFDTGNILLRSGASWYILFKMEWPNTEEFSQDGVWYEATSTIEIPFLQYNE